jgi:hypothetical protein
LEEKVLLKRSLCHAVTAVLVLVGVATLAPAAKAGTYTVPFCDRSSTHSTAGWTHATTTGAGPYFWVDGDCGYGRVYRRFEIWTVPAGASDDWTFAAPDGTYISKLEMNQETSARSTGAMVAIWSWQEDGSRTLTAAARPGSQLPTTTTYTFPLSGSKVTKVRNSLLCQSAADCPGTDSNGDYGNVDYWHGGVVHLVDPSQPTFDSVSGDGWKAEPSDGERAIDFSVADQGAGVKDVRLYVDGVLQVTKTAGCVAERPVPCPATWSGSFGFDTTRLSEGAHTIEVRAADGAANEATKQLAVTVRRPPVASDPASGGSPVAITDTTWSGSNVPAVGDHLHGSQGTWTGTGLTFTYRWLRCDGDGTNCVPIPGATGVDYTPTSADVGHALQFCVTATNSGGSATSCSAPTPAVIGSHPSGSGGGGTTSGTADPVEQPGQPSKPTPSSTTPGAGPSSGSRGAANGSPAADKVVLTALANNRSSSMKVKFGKRVPIGGRLVGPGGAPIAGAILDVQTRTAVPGAAVAAAGKVVTGGDGRFTYVAPAGPSRVVRIAYRSHTADESFADTSDVTLLVTAGVTIKATPKKVRNRHATVFTGRLLGKPISKRGVIVDLQVFFRNKWRTFGAPRTNRAGKYRFKYRFMAGAATWKFRARVRRETSYPYLEGFSTKTVKVKVIN